MIARTWNGRVPAQHADGFERHLLATGVAEALALSGCLGADVLRAEAEEHVDFRLVTFWRSWEAVLSFAGAEPGRAVLYPGDEEYGLIPSLVVEHHHVAHRSPGQ
ncbi:antibiotic biosynthesis monooxygenase [Nonomuraea sp. NPDC049784]|uniref:antibiotic biosynthesis monooxygenase family protein n=1 Tax=Nonomuraea sp. NPDC049784 TaxID=3154361 RepID=UPI0033FD189C